MSDNNSEDSVTGGNDGASASWRNSLPDDLKNEKTFERFKTVDDLARSYKSLQVEFYNSGKADAVIPPKPDAPKDAWDKFYNKLGRPESLDKYDIKLGDDLAKKVTLEDHEIATIKQNAFDAGLTPKQAQKQLEMYAAGKVNAIEKVVLEDTSKFNQAEAALKARWGDKYEEQKNLTKTMLTRFLPADLKEKVADISNNPVIVEVMHEMSKLFKEDTILGDNGSVASQTPEEMRAESRRLMMTDEFKNPRHPLHDQTKAKVSELQRKAVAATKK